MSSGRFRFAPFWWFWWYLVLGFGRVWFALLVILMMCNFELWSVSVCLFFNRFNDVWFWALVGSDLPPFGDFGDIWFWALIRSNLPPFNDFNNIQFWALVSFNLPFLMSLMIFNFELWSVPICPFWWFRVSICFFFGGV